MGFDGATVMILVLLLLAVVLVLVFLRYVPLGLWVRALSSGVKVKVSALIGMRLRRISPHRLVDTLIMVLQGRPGYHPGSAGKALAGGRQH